jgi:hypothetical protein
VNTVATSLDAFYLEHRQCGDLDGGVEEDDRVSRGRLIARVMRTEMGLAALNSEERRVQP